MFNNRIYFNLKNTKHDKAKKHPADFGSRIHD